MWYNKLPKEPLVLLLLCPIFCTSQSIPANIWAHWSAYSYSPSEPDSTSRQGQWLPASSYYVPPPVWPVQYHCLWPPAHTPHWYRWRQRWSLSPSLCSEGLRMRYCSLPPRTFSWWRLRPCSCSSDSPVPYPTRRFWGWSRLLRSEEPKRISSIPFRPLHPLYLDRQAFQSMRPSVQWEHWPKPLRYLHSG